MEILNSGLYRKFTLVSAPAGYGKSSIVREWIADSSLKAGWISLEEGDKSVLRFFGYLTTVIQRIFPDLETEGSGQTTALDRKGGETLVSGLVNSIASLPDNFILVLDDLYLIESPEISHLLQFFIDHLPQQCHLVLLTRKEPDLPLSTYRMRDQVTEIGSSTLRFSNREAEIFLKEVMGLSISENEIEEIARGTEGWVAGLQGAALAFRPGETIPLFSNTSIDEDHNTISFLADEVLHKQEERVRRFLLFTSIPDEICPSLCEAVLEKNTGSGAEMLQFLCKARLFLTPIENSGQWYRYHHLFRQMLRMMVEKEYPAELPGIHTRASRWFRDQKQWVIAARLAVAGEDPVIAVEVLEQAWSEMSNMNESELWNTWRNKLPKEIRDRYPVLKAQEGYAEISTGRLEKAETLFNEADEIRKECSHEQMPNQGLFQILSAYISIGRAYISQAYGDDSTTIMWAKNVLRNETPSNDFLDGQARALLGLSYWNQGELVAARNIYSKTLIQFEATGNLNAILSNAFVLGEILIGLGQLMEAERNCERALRLMKEQGSSEISGSEDIYRVLAEIAIEKGDLDHGESMLQKASIAGKSSFAVAWNYRYLSTAAWLQACKGNHEDAHRLLDEAERAPARSPLPDLRPLSALRARVLLMEKRIQEAGLAIHNSGSSTEKEYQTLTRVRILLAKQENGESEKALTLLETLYKTAMERGHKRTIIEINLLRAIYADLNGEKKEAKHLLESGLTAASQDGQIQVFLNELPGTGDLLQRTMDSMPPSDYLATLNRKRSHLQRMSKDAQESIPEPLTKREREVLECIAAGLSNAEICERLFLALDTVKGHNRRIFEKLNVRRRTQAVSAARKFGLISN
ncbi:LuxR C-terminal-related transcriptional regulator [Spirochaeta dissipatitropha]